MRITRRRVLAGALGAAAMSGVALGRARRPALEKPELALGFIPLTDCAPLVIAAEKRFFAREGLQVRLSREPS